LGGREKAIPEAKSVTIWWVSEGGRSDCLSSCGAEELQEINAMQNASCVFQSQFAMALHNKPWAVVEVFA
tara:strand:+ start:486 stop:695 length:210 start_codon:yes stop_codon:yes gene_type:complete